MSGDHCDVNSYRPIIAILSALAILSNIVFEGIVLDHCISISGSAYHLNNMAFCAIVLLIFKLLEFQDFVKFVFMDSCQFDCVFLDFAKAINKVTHCQLIAKLEGYG